MTKGITLDIALLIDFGSTYTKVVAVDLVDGCFLGRAQCSSTVDTDVTEGLLRALHLLKEQSGIRDEQVTLKLACSSAAGGLRVVAVGHIGRLTAEAANRAALGAGAKVVQVFDRALNSSTIKRLQAASPDIILLAGGVDGGNDVVILRNARNIAASDITAPVVMAGNIAVQKEVCSIFREVGQAVYECSNVMPELNVLDVEPARQVIRDVYIRHIIEAKGLGRAAEYVGDVIMPTPMAVLRMTELLAVGSKGEAGLGETVVIDVGGATTDVHSGSWGVSEEMSAKVLDLPEPFAKRTVEGDLGLRQSAETLLEAAQQSYIPHEAVGTLRTNEALLLAYYLATHTSTLPNTAAEWDMDVAMAMAGAYIAMERHAGVLETSKATGFEQVQRGKDLSRVGVLIGTGGVFAFGSQPQAILSACLANPANMFSLRPKAPQIYIDGDYILYAGGLLSTIYPDKALRLVKGSLRSVETPSRAPVSSDA